MVLELRYEKVDERKKALHFRVLTHSTKTLKSEKCCEIVIVSLKSSLAMLLVTCHEIIVKCLERSILLLVIHKGVCHDFSFQCDLLVSCTLPLTGAGMVISSITPDKASAAVCASL